MREFAMTDDELVFLAVEAGAAPTVVLPTVGKGTEDLIQAGVRGRRSLVVRATEVPPERWREVLADASRLTESGPDLLVVVASGWAPVGGSVLTACFAGLVGLTLDVVDPEGLHRGLVGPVDEVSRPVLDAVEAAWADPMPVPEGWPVELPPPDGLLLRSTGEQVLVQHGSASRRTRGRLLGETLSRAELDGWVRSVLHVAA